MAYHFLKNLFAKVHSRVGDFWWYSLMLFCAQRAADCMNVFVGLWLVPKYVAPAELGAILPLTTFASCLSMPISICANTFRNEISCLAANKEFGKLKTLLCGTFLVAILFLVLIIPASYFFLPSYLERMRLTKGSLGVLIIAIAFVNAIQPIFSNALQALKKFKDCAIIGIVTAPARLLVMLFTMPLRPISGYFVGQATPPSFGIVASIFALRREMFIKAEPYWNVATINRVIRFAFLSGLNTITVTFWTFASTTILRQRLPAIDSAAFYMTTRFSEISGFITTTLTFTIFPYAANLAKENKSTIPLIVRASTVTLVASGLLALGFAMFGKHIMAVLPNGDSYCQYFWAIPWMIGITTLSAITSYHTTAETSAARFAYLRWQVPITVIFPIMMLLTTGYGYFEQWLSPNVRTFLINNNINSLTSYLTWLTIFEILRLFCATIEMYRIHKKTYNRNHTRHD